MKKSNFNQHILKYLDKTPQEASLEEIYHAIIAYIRDTLTPLSGILSTHAQQKTLYYISSEFLMGKMLLMYVRNLGIYDELLSLLHECNYSLSELENLEMEPALGNGGLGRLAACFLDSLTHLGLPVLGISLNYHFGLFQQNFKNNQQIETPNPWISPHSYLLSEDLSYTTKFNQYSLKSHLYTLGVSSEKNSLRNYLCLFDVQDVQENIISQGIQYDQKDIPHNLTLFLYPDDSQAEGKLLRIYQQYFLVSNAVSFIFDRVKNNKQNLHDLDQWAIIQINDTHPSLVIVELIYQLQLHGIDFHKAIGICQRTVAYTNHTILNEALEKWPLDLLKRVLHPEIIALILQLDQRIKNQFSNPEIYIIDKYDIVHMAHLAIHYSFSINGVSALHTQILKESTLKEFYLHYPYKFNNKTNGISFSRWLNKANPELCHYIEHLIGSSFHYRSQDLTRLLDFYTDKNVLEELHKIKKIKKQQFCDWVHQENSSSLSSDFVFDVQIKRIHEYKRQLMNALSIIHQYLLIKKGQRPKNPICFIFSGKAAPSYSMAKNIIHLILCIAELCEKDTEVNPYLKVIFIENYNVSVAEKIIPSADISEQISLASKEASGTGNMKLMLNGALTLGTMDGANIEIYERVGKDNIYIFGQNSQDIISLYQNNSYSSFQYYQSSSLIQRCVDFIIHPTLITLGNKEQLYAIYNELLHKDYYMSLIDLCDYIKVKHTMLNDYPQSTLWAQKMLTNIAHSGYFSSDRTITSYNQDIWKLHIGN